MVGGFWKLKADTFFILLGFTLLLASVFYGSNPNLQQKGVQHSNTIGIGRGHWLALRIGKYWRGIFLSPILHLVNWADAKRFLR